MAKVVVPSSIVFEVLDRDNYEDWKEMIQAYLEFKDLWDVVESNEQPPDREADEAMFKAWKKKNSEALHAIKISCGRHFFPKIRGIREANKAWRTLEANFNPIYRQQGDEGNVDDEYQKASKSLADALSRSKICDAIELCKENPDLLKKRLPNYRPLLHQLIMLVSNFSEEEKVVEMLKLNHFPKQALEMRDSSDRTPLALAIDSLHYNRMIDGLYSITPSDVWTLEAGKNGATLIIKCFEVGLLDFASKLLKDHPHCIFAKDVNGLSPLYAAARAPRLFDSHIYDSAIALSPHPYKFPKFTCYCINAIMSIISTRGRELQKLSGRRRLRGIFETLIAIRNAIRDSNMTSDLLRGAFFEAIKCGNFNFIVMLISYNKKNLEEVNDKSQNIYMCAIEYRQPKVFSLIFWDKKDRKRQRNYANVLQDKWKNNLLHMAATWPPPYALDFTSKPTLLMNSEAMWFEKVWDLAPDLRKKVNIDGKIPDELFRESHKDLIMEAKKEMKESIGSWGIVGPLIIAITFAAAFQIPGGYNQEMGFPIFLNKKLFKFYMAYVSISLFSATTSVLKFLEILSSDHHKKDFLSSLRTYVRTYNMTTGNLFSSLGNMLGAFILGQFLILDGESAILLPIALIATFLCCYIVYTQYPLLLEGLTTYKLKNSLFEKNIGAEVDRIFKMLNGQLTEEVAT